MEETKEKIGTAKGQSPMPLLNELIISIVGGVLTAIILGLFTRRPKASKQQIMQQTIEKQPAAKNGSSTFGQFMHLLLAVLGGLAIFSTFGRYLFKSGILERGLPMRILVIVCATVFVWWVLLLFRGKR